MMTLELKNTTLAKVFEGCFKDGNGNKIYKDDFGTYRVMVNGNPEKAASLEKAIEIMNDDRYWN